MVDKDAVAAQRKAQIEGLRTLVRNYKGPVTESPFYEAYAQLLVSDDLVRGPSLIDLAIEAARDVDQLENTARDRMEVLSALGEEIGELSTEVRIAEGLTYKQASPDRVFGEAVDAMLVAIDMIYVDNRRVTEEQITTYARLKLNKWKRKVGEQSGRIC